VAAAKLGSSVVLVGCVGSDGFANQLKSNLASEKVDLTHITEIREAASGVALIVVDDQGQNSIVVASGANARLSPMDVEAATDTIDAADVVLLQLEVTVETVQRAAQIAHEYGTKVILNPAPAQNLPADLLALVDILVPNENETSHLTGLPTHNLDGLTVAASSLLASGVGAVILTLGDRGALLAQEGVLRHFPAFSMRQIVDTTAAGDAFVGGLATAVAEGKTLAEAVPWGNATGALAVTKAGAQPSLPYRRQVEALLSQGTAEQLQGVEL